jgi:hypothetical protein
MAFQGNPLALPHPKAIEIAVATRRALDSGLIRGKSAPTIDGVVSAGGWNKRDHVSGSALIKKCLDNIRAAQKRCGGEPFSFHVVLIDTSEAFAVQVRAGGVVLESRHTGPRDSLIATTCVGLQAIIAREITFWQAIHSGLLLVEGNQRLAQICLLPGDETAKAGLLSITTRHPLVREETTNKPNPRNDRLILELDDDD